METGGPSNIMIDWEMFRFYTHIIECLFSFMRNRQTEILLQIRETKIDSELISMALL